MSYETSPQELCRQESEELLEVIEETALNMEGCENDPEAVNTLFRAFHTIKGSGAMFGFDAVAGYTHHLENALEAARTGHIPLSRDLIDIILESKDHIRVLFDLNDEKPTSVVERENDLLSQLSALLPESDTDGQSSSADGASEEDAGLEAPAGTVEEFWRIRFVPPRSLFASGMEPAFLLDELGGLGDCDIECSTEDVPSLKELDAESCYLKWDIRLTTTKGLNAIKDVFIFIEDESEIEYILEGQIELNEPTDEPEEEAEPAAENTTSSPEQASKPVKSTAPSSGNGGGRQGDVVRIPSDKLDKLINLVGELVITQAQLTQVANTLDEMQLRTSTEEVERLTADLRDTVLTMRMMPIGTTFGRFRRLVRDLSRDLGKEIDMVTEGGDTELDKTVLEKLADPLVHLIRNSIDHGIEDPDVREGAGKHRRGTIRLLAAHAGGRVVITVEDDGGGLNAEAIRKKAIERGLISEDAELTDREIYSLILMPGFSTRDQATSVSGRGVGMDVVKREIEALRGSIDIVSTPGQGSRFDLWLPLTLAIIDGLLVEVAGTRYVIPVCEVQECIEVTRKNYSFSRERALLRVREELVPYVRLRSEFGFSESEGIEEAVIVDMEGIRVALVVDKVIGDHQTVIKSLGRLYRDMSGITGATILGDGTVSLILDVAAIVSRASKYEEEVCASAGV